MAMLQAAHPAEGAMMHRNTLLVKVKLLHQLIRIAGRMQFGQRRLAIGIDQGGEPPELL